MLTALRTKLATEMPVTQHLGITVAGIDDGTLVLQAPLEANRNHQGTAFAGSLNALATLAGWSAVWLLVHDGGLDARVVIQDSSIRYLRPVTSDFAARCARPAAAAIDRLLETVRKKGRGRIELEVSVVDSGGPAVHFVGRYVVSRGPSGGRPGNP